jgi:Fur family transcriptional regulator, ferric uptake regulator
VTSVAGSLEVHDTVESRLRAAGQRYTGQRRRLVDILLRAGHPLTITDILRGRRDLAQSSVYRNLSALEHAGIVRRVSTDEEFGLYELTEELTGHHHHLICQNCGRVRDLPLPGAFERTLDRTLDRVAGQAGFAEVSHRLDLIGLCADCAARG